MSCWDIWLMRLSGLLTPLIAFITVRILFGQYLLARQRWKLDLFDKRFFVYEATRVLIATILDTTDIDDEKISIFRQSNRGSEFLFGTDTDIQDHLNLLHSKATQLVSCIKRIDTGEVGSEGRNADIDTQSKLIKWFEEQQDISVNLFKKHLMLPE